MESDPGLQDTSKALREMQLLCVRSGNQASKNSGWWWRPTGAVSVARGLSPLAAQGETGMRRSSGASDSTSRPVAITTSSWNGPSCDCPEETAADPGAAFTASDTPRGAGLAATAGRVASFAAGKVFALPKFFGVLPASTALGVFSGAAAREAVAEGGKRSIMLLTERTISTKWGRDRSSRVATHLRASTPNSCASCVGQAAETSRLLRQRSTAPGWLGAIVSATG
mmetsp:Transcript_100800/g.314238  ORF Transcript_100800/g.314238 Transcript_100800/m.314238 type:complete len:226 (-) Transcript_100800:273-950(-)